MAKKKIVKNKPSPKKKVNKSQAIRDYAAKHPNAGPTEISTALNKAGVKVTPPQVSNALSTAKKKTGGKVRATKKTTAAAGNVKLDDLVAANNFASKVGGVDAAKGLLSALEKLQK